MSERQSRQAFRSFRWSLIGAQENQIFLTRGDWIAKRLGIRKMLGTNVLPITFGVPFGINVVLPLNLPLPTKIVTEVLEPIDIAETFGVEPDVDEVDSHVRGVMQTALDRLGASAGSPFWAELELGEPACFRESESSAR